MSTEISGAAFRQLEARLAEFEALRDAEIVRRTRAVVEEVTAQYAPLIDSLEQSVSQVRDRHQSQLIEEQQARLRDPHRVEWVWDSEIARVVQSGRYGLLEVCTAESDFRGQPTFTRPKVGDIYLRVLDKRRRPTLAVKCGESPYGWKPEGWRPEDPRDVKCLENEGAAE